jgi:hypothetical protein
VPQCASPVERPDVCARHQPPRRDDSTALRRLTSATDALIAATSAQSALNAAEVSTASAEIATLSRRCAWLANFAEALAVFLVVVWALIGVCGACAAAETRQRGA